jgi:excisionase family DNA binding protein
MPSETFAEPVAQAVANVPALIGVEAVAEMLSCSTRHVYRLADAGFMPPKLKLGGLCRWRRAEIETWVENGCPTYRRGGR